MTLKKKSHSNEAAVMTTHACKNPCDIFSCIIGVPLHGWTAVGPFFFFFLACMRQCDYMGHFAVI